MVSENPGASLRNPIILMSSTGVPVCIEPDCDSTANNAANSLSENLMVP